jgi:PKD repeat protein
MRRARLAAMVGRARSAALLLLAACGCRARFFTPEGGPTDAGGDVAAADAPEPLALDFAVTGCAQYDVAAARCLGTPPLILSFSPVSSPSLTRFLWTFGDGTPSSSDLAPTHTYALPGIFDVTVVGAGSVGTVSRTRPHLVSVAALGAGAPCDVDAQCATGLRCVCGAATCAPAYARGLCTAACTGGVCGAGAVCADLGRGGSGGAGSTDAGAAADGGASAADLLQPLCLAACQQDADCAGGLVCRDLPGSGVAGQPRWARACFPGTPALGDVGSPCRDPEGTLSPAACLSGVCADLGALGLCTATCSLAAPCPTGSSCAKLGDGRSLCLRDCHASQDCARDPLLGCVTPGATGSLGFTIDGAPAGATYCAPRTCTVPADCAPAGTCIDHCVRNP